MRPARAALSTAVALSALALVGCGTDEPAEPSPSASLTATADASPSPDTSPVVDIPDTPVGRQTQWLLDQLAAEEGPDAAAATEHFGELALAQIPAEQMAQVFDQLRAAGPFLPQAYDGTDTQASTEVRAGADVFALQVVLDADGLIETFLLQPVLADVDSWEELDEELGATGAEVSLLAARVEDGRCEPIHATAADQLRPSASMFKLYVLGAVAQAVIEGELSWTDTLAVTDDLRSLPSGELQDAPEGTEVSVADAAEAMIAISDNTATDLLMDRVGRDAVEQAVRDLGHGTPAALEPFPTTREAFWLGWGEAGLSERWHEADTATRAGLLAEVPSGPLPIDPATVTTPRWTDDVDWFASAADVCAAHVGLQELATDPATGAVRDILAVNPGVPADPEVWPYVGFKGGSSPGVLAGSWYAEHIDGTASVIVVQLSSPNAVAVANTRLVFDAAEQGLQLLAGS